MIQFLESNCCIELNLFTFLESKYRLKSQDTEKFKYKHTILGICTIIVLLESLPLIFHLRSSEVGDLRRIL
jgi:hypothetical protein